jgi:CysZ protein
MRAQAFAACFAVPLLTVLWVVELFVAPAVFVTVPLKLIVTAFSLAWNLFDYPLTLRGIRMRERLRLVLAYKGAALGFGLGFALLFWFPCFGVLMLPVGVAGATRLVWQIMRADPNVLPSIERQGASPRALEPAPGSSAGAEPPIVPGG